MDVYDVDRIQQPNARQIHASSRPEKKRLTFQHFNTKNPTIPIIAPHNCDARLRARADQPLDVLFDVAYGVAALKAWGTDTFLEFIRTSTKSTYYDNGDSSNENSGVKHDREEKLVDSSSARAERAARRSKKADQRASRTTQPHDLHDLVLGIWMHNARKNRHKAQATVNKKVQTWLDSSI